jgi:hypothetical protein
MFMYFVHLHENRTMKPVQICKKEEGEMRNDEGRSI